MAVGILGFIRGKWLGRRMLCPGCGYDLGGLIESGAAVCPECGKGVERGPEGARGAMWKDGRDSLRVIVARSMIVGAVIVTPWFVWLIYLVWRISIQRRLSPVVFAAVVGVLLVCSIAALMWAAHAATVGSVRLFNLIVRALASISGSAISGWMMYVAMWWGMKVWL